MKAKSILLSALGLLVSCTGSGDEAVTISVIGKATGPADPNAVPLDNVGSVFAGALTQGLVAFDATGQIEPALAESWIVTDDGLSYIFRIQRSRWSDGERVTARDVAQSLNRVLAPASKNKIKPLLWGISEIVAMTDTVIEIRLSSPQPLLLQLLAQPEMGISKRGRGTGPYRVHAQSQRRYVLRPALLEGQKPDDVDEAIMRRSERRVRGESASRAVARFVSGDAALVLGGGYDSLPFVQAARLRDAQFRRDPAIGLFGLVATREAGPAAEIGMRRALAMAIDRPRLLSRFGEIGWRPLETLLLGSIQGTSSQSFPEWGALNATQRIDKAASIVKEWRAAHGSAAPVVRLALPTGPGSTILFAQIAADWRAIGVDAKRVGPRDAADFRLIDAVAPYGGVQWYLSQFPCSGPNLCSEEANVLMSQAREAQPIAERVALLAEADAALTSAQVYIPIATPMRWSAVATKLVGYAENPFAIHLLNRLGRARG